MNEDLEKKEREEREAEARKVSAHLYAGDFLLWAVASAPPPFPESLSSLVKIAQDVDLSRMGNIVTPRNFRFSASEAILDMAYARATEPYSKARTVWDVFHLMAGRESRISYRQALEALAWAGSYCEDASSCMTGAAKRWGMDFSLSLFDSNNFYYEIDPENEGKKGHSKEGRKSPIAQDRAPPRRQCNPRRDQRLSMLWPGEARDREGHGKP